jgi:hypothetical protein
MQLAGISTKQHAGVCDELFVRWHSNSVTRIFTNMFMHDIVSAGRNL